MSDQEKKSSGKTADGISVVVVEQSADSRHNRSYRPTELQEEQSDVQHKRSKAPAVPSVTEDLKHVPQVSADAEDEHKERKVCERVPPEKQKHSSAKILSSNTKRRGSTTSPETIKLAQIELDMKKSTTPLPIPAEVVPLTSGSSSELEKTAERKVDEDITPEEIAELRTPEPSKKLSEWDDVEEAGGLPRSESRASRMSRAVRQLFCCGQPYSPPSEDDISCHRHYAI